MLSRTRTRFGRPFVMVDAMHGGNGALCDHDGVTNQLVGNGDLPNNPVEVTETRYPVRVNRLEFAADVAGPGRYRGGMGVRKEYELLEPGCSVSFVIENTIDATSTGVFDGGAGKHGTLTINPGLSDAVKLTRAQAALGPFPAGTRIEVVTGGGGGWGDPRTRDPDQVVMDVRNGFISAETAWQVYGVAVVAHGPDLGLDSRRTRRPDAA
jgi:N-methylhydantoinase B